MKKVTVFYYSITAEYIKVIVVSEEDLDKYADNYQGADSVVVSHEDLPKALNKIVPTWYRKFECSQLPLETIYQLR